MRELSRRLTVGPILERFDFHPRGTVSTRILGMPPDILPREVGSEPVHFRTVVSDEEYQVFGGEVPRPAPASQITRLDYLHMLRSGGVDVRRD